MWIETAGTAAIAVVETEFIRQQWRMWIETGMVVVWLRGGCNSFASNGECGLKLNSLQLLPHSSAIIHSPAMANVD